MTEVSARHRLARVTLGRRGRRFEDAATTFQRYWLAGPLVAAAAVVALDADVPLLRPLLALALLLGFPTLALHRRALFLSDSSAARLFHAFGLSLLALIVVGFLLNLSLPALGVDHPLAAGPVALTWLALDLALLGWRPRIGLVDAISWRPVLHAVLDLRFELAQTLAVGAVVAAVVGAVRLNNGAGGGVALLAEALAAAALLALMLRPEGSLRRDLRSVALVATSLLLATSLRGWSITGHDIQAEFLAFRLTDAGQHWRMDALANAYNACLSVNILPTVLAQTTGLSGEFVFKVLLQLVFALVPVLTFLYSRRFLSRRLSLVAATLTLAFPTFFTDMPYLVRQEIAFFFLALLLLAATEQSAQALPRWRRSALVAVFGVGVVLSHYSTTYLMLIGLVLGLLMMVLTQVVRHRFRSDPATGASAFRGSFGLVLLNPALVAFLILASLAWAGPITHTGGHAFAIAKQTVGAITGNGHDGPGSSDASYRLFAKDRTTARERLNSFVGETVKYRDAHIPRPDVLIKHPGSAELRPTIIPAEKAPVTGLGRVLDSRGVDPARLNAAAKVAAAGVMQVLLLLGLLWLVWGRLGRKDQVRPSREVTYLSLGAVGALVLIVLVPNLSVDYGVLRAFQQTLLVVAPVMAAGFGMVLRPLGPRVARLALVLPVVLLLVLSGVLPALVGGQQERLALSNSGSYFERFYSSDSETRALAWLAATDGATGWRSKIISNRNVAVKMLAVSNNAAPVADRLYPTLLTRDAYVYVDAQIIERGRSTIFYTGDLISYVYPQRALNQRLDLVYSSPRSRIYR